MVNGLLLVNLRAWGPIYKNLTIIVRRCHNYDRFLGMIHLQNYKFVLDSVHKLAYDLPERNL